MQAEPAGWAERVDDEAPVTGYRIILPDQWAQVPLRQGTSAVSGKPWRRP